MSTIENVKAALTKVVQRLGKQRANDIAATNGGADGKGTDWDTIKEKKFDRVISKCKSVIEAADKADKKSADQKANTAAVDVVGKQITALADKIKREADAEADAKQKGDSFFAHLVEKLKEVEPLAKAAGMTVKAIKLKYIGDRLGDTRFKLALCIARGKITHEQVNEDEAAKKRAQREAAKASQPRAPALAAPRVTGNSPSEDAVEARKAEMARIAGEEPAAPAEHTEQPQDSPPVAERVPTQAELGDDALATFKRAAQALLDFPEELEHGVKWFNNAFAAERAKRAKQSLKKAA